MEPKFKIGDKVTLIHNNKKVRGVVQVRDQNQMYGVKEDFSYDVELDAPDKMWIKHIPESDLSHDQSSKK